MLPAPSFLGFAFPFRQCVVMELTELWDTEGDLGTATVQQTIRQHLWCSKLKKNQQKPSWYFLPEKRVVTIFILSPYISISLIIKKSFKNQVGQDATQLQITEWKKKPTENDNHSVLIMIFFLYTFHQRWQIPYTQPQYLTRVVSKL